MLLYFCMHTLSLLYFFITLHEETHLLKKKTLDNQIIKSPFLFHFFKYHGLPSFSKYHKNFFYLTFPSTMGFQPFPNIMGFQIHEFETTISHFTLLDAPLFKTFVSLYINQFGDAHPCLQMSLHNINKNMFNVLS